MSVCLRHPLLVSALALWPCALDVVENGADVRVAQHVCEAGHVALVSAADHGGGAFPNDAEQDIVRMVPGVAAGVVGWRRQPAGRKRRAPARLALQFRAVAGGALIRIDLASLRDDVRRRHGGGCGTGITPASKDREDHTSDDQTDHDSISESFFQDVYRRSLRNNIRVWSRPRCASGEAPATIDILVSNAYLCSMLERVVTMLAILAITVVTTVTSAHATRMSMNSGVDHAMHVADMMHSPVISGFDCDAGEHCGSADAEMCEFVCAGLSAFLTSAGEEAGHAYGAASHDVPSAAIHVSRAPGLNERPPKLRLL